MLHVSITAFNHVLAYMNIACTPLSQSMKIHAQNDKSYSPVKVRENFSNDE